MIADSVVQDAVFVSRLAVGAVVWTVVRVVSCCVQCVFCYAGSELVFVGFFSESFSPLVGFSSVFFPWWMLGIILLNAVPFLLAPPALVYVVCSMISNDDVFVWRAQQAPYHILPMVMCMACW